MINQRIRLKGFTGIQSGMGLEEVEVDLRGLRGLVAICGDNGGGKTTFLECLQPFRQMVSREGGLKEHTYLSQSVKELWFTMDKVEYHSTVLVNPQKEKSTGVLLPGAKGGLVSDYDTELRKLMGSPAMFMNSVFAGQKSKRFTDLTEGKRKELFVEFLGLDRLINYCQISRGCEKLIKVKRTSAEEELRRLQDKIGDLDELKQKIKTKEEDLETFKKYIAHLNNLLDEAKAKHGLLEAQALEVVKKKGEIEALKAKIDGMERAIRTEIEGGISRLRTHEAGLEREVKSVEQDIADASDRILEADDKLNLIAGIESVDPQTLDKMNIELKLIDERIRRLNDTAKKEAGLSATLKAKDKEVKRLEDRPEDCKIDDCVFIAGALQAREEVKKIQQEMKGMAIDLASLPEITQRRDSLSNELSTLIENQQKVADREHLKQRIKENDNLITVKTNKTNELKKKIEKTSKSIGSLNVQSALDRNQGLKDLSLELSKARESIDEDIIFQRDKLKNEMEGMQNTIRETGDKIAQTGAGLGVLKNEVADTEKAQEEIKSLVGRIKFLESEQSDWVVLGSACGKDNLQALEIDAVAPTVTGYANSLLSACYGSRFAIKFETVDEKGRETFDVVVIDNDRNRPMFIEDLSGGEEVWILKALRLAVTLMMKSRSGRRFQTLYSDEEDGALSVANKVSYVNMYRKAMDIGGFEVAYLISHSPEVIQLCDSVMRFKEGGIEIE